MKDFLIQNTGDNLTQEDSGVLITAPRVVIEGNQFKDVLFGISLRQASDSEIRGNVLSSKMLPVARRGDLVSNHREATAIV